MIEDRNRDPGRPIVPQCTMNVDHAPKPWISLAEFTDVLLVKFIESLLGRPFFVDDFQGMDSYPLDYI